MNRFAFKKLSMSQMRLQLPWTTPDHDPDPPYQTLQVWIVSSRTSTLCFPAYLGTQRKQVSLLCVFLTDHFVLGSL